MSEENETKPDNVGNGPASGTPAPVENKKTSPDTEQAEEKKSTELIDKANEAAQRLERANVEHAKIVARQEAMQVTKTLGGKADAGIPAKVETDAEYAERVMANDIKTK